MENKQTSGGIGCGGLLQVAFIVLKLCGVITWSWWWVLAPTWISLGIAIILVGIAFAYIKSKRNK